MKYEVIRDENISERMDFLRRLFATSEMGEHQIGIHLLEETESRIDDIDASMHYIEGTASCDYLYETILNASYIVIALDYVFQLIVGGHKMRDEIEKELDEKLNRLMEIRDHLLSRANIQFGVEAYMADLISAPYRFKGVYTKEIAEKMFSGYECDGEYVICLEDVDGEISTMDVNLQEDIFDTVKDYLDHFLTYVEQFKTSAKNANIPAETLESASIDSTISSLYLDLATKYPDRVKYDSEGNLDKMSFPDLYRIETCLNEHLSDEYYVHVDQVFKRILVEAIDAFCETMKDEPDFSILEEPFDYARDFIMEELEDCGFEYFAIPYLEGKHDKLDLEQYRQKLEDCDEDLEYMENNFTTTELAIYQIICLVDEEVLGSYIPIEYEAWEIYRMYELCQFQDLATEMFSADNEDFLEDDFDDEDFEEIEEDDE